MRSEVNWALLALVIQRPSYGYELVQRFERVYGDSLELSSVSQVYRALDALARRGWIERVAAPQPDDTRQPKPHYRITERGMCVYREQLIEQSRQQRTRSRIFARQLAMLPVADALAVIERFERSYLGEASRLTNTNNGGDSADGETLSGRLEREADRLIVHARLDWIRYARSQLTQSGERHAQEPPA